MSPVYLNYKGILPAVSIFALGAAALLGRELMISRGWLGKILIVLGGILFVAGLIQRTGVFSSNPGPSSSVVTALGAALGLMGADISKPWYRLYDLGLGFLLVALVIQLQNRKRAMANQSS